MVGPQAQGDPVSLMIKQEVFQNSFKAVNMHTEGGKKFKKISNAIQNDITRDFQN